MSPRLQVLLRLIHEALHGHTEPWGSFLDVKHWKPVGDPHRFDGQRIVIGSVTDGYNPFEEHFQRTRPLLEELRGTTAEILICTKSDLVLRDLDLLREFPHVTVSWSVNTLDEAFRADMDRAVSIERRLEAMRRVYEAGIRTVCFVSPIFPGITDPKAIIERVREFVDLVWLENLNLRGQFKGPSWTTSGRSIPNWYLYTRRSTTAAGQTTGRRSSGRWPPMPPQTVCLTG